MPFHGHHEAFTIIISNLYKLLILPIEDSSGMKPWIYWVQLTEIVNVILDLMGNTVLSSTVPDMSSSWLSLIAD